MLPLAGTAIFCALTLVPPVRSNERLTWTFLGVGAALFAWCAMLWMRQRRGGPSLCVELAPPVKSHYIQASVQLCIYAYWGYYWRKVYSEAPLIASQLLFLYIFDALLSWTRGRNLRLGFGPLPIILSSNVFIWFKDDWYFFQFLLVATGILGKEFIRWNKGGKKTHIFNPSAFALGLFSIVLIATQTTGYTWGVEIAATLASPPHIYLEIFLLGLVVQFFFSVTLMTLSATAVLCLLDLAYHGSTGVYEFVDTNIPIAIFLGLHLLVTDPATSPRTNVGRVIFGGLYGLANFVLYEILERAGVPEFYDKLLPVPILNLSIQLIDRVANIGVLGKLTHWEAKFQPRKWNLVHMAIWAALFTTMLASGFVEAPHPGASIAFWKKAFEDGKPRAGPKLYKVVGSQAEAGSPTACNELGVMYMEGTVVAQSRAAAGHYFAQACALGDACGCANVATQFLFFHEGQSEEDVARALDRVELGSDKGTDGRSCYLMGYAYETGTGRTMDKRRALELYKEGARRGNVDACKGLADIRLSSGAGPNDFDAAARVLQRACEAGDAESCRCLAYMLHDGNGVPRDEEKARARLEQACALGSQEACAALRQTEMPPFSAPRARLAPVWLTASLASSALASRELDPVETRPAERAQR
jgi:TPR repeat protein